MGSGAQFRRFTVTHADLTASATTQNVTLFTLPKGSVVCGVRIKHSTAFAGGTLSAMTVSVGTSGDTTAYAGAFDVFQTVADTTFQVTDQFNAASYAAHSIVAAFTATGDNVVNATAGVVDIDIYYLNVTTPL
jgi:hypothetical protein